MRTVLRGATLVVALMMLVALAVPALADHAHWLETPGTFIGDIGSGQTSIEDTAHGGHHRFHDNVHLGNAGTVLNERTPVSVGKYPRTE